MDYNNQSKKDQINALEQLNVHDHLCSVYETKEEQLATIIPFIEIGLTRGEKCIYVVDDNTAREVLSAMKLDGIDVDSNITSGSLSIFNKQDTYLKHGYFDPELMIQFLKDAVDSAKEGGYSALRITVEMTWMLGGSSGVKRSMEYETRLSTFISENDIVAVCQYNRKHFDPETILNAIRTHPMVVHGSLVCKNFYYVPPEEFLKPEQTSLEIDRLLSNIHKNEQKESERKENEQMEKRLDDYVEKSRSWLECSPACTKIVDLDFNLQYMSNAGIKYLKINDITQYYGKQYPFDFYPESFRNLMTENLEKVRETGEKITQEASVVDIEGNELWFHSTLVPVNGDEDQIDCIMIVSIDITESKISEKKYYDLVKTAQDAIISDISGVVSEWNESAERLFGYSKDEIIGQPVNILLADRYREKYQSEFDRFIKTGRTMIAGKTIEVVGLTKEDIEIFLEVSLTYQKNEKGLYLFTSIIRDITDRKQSAKRLEAQHEITKVLARSSTIKESSSMFLQTICTALEWDFGEIWEYDQKKNILHNTESWHVPELGALKFEAVTKGLTFPPEIGLPGRVFESAEPLWISDVVHDSNFLRASIADIEGLHGALGFPIILNNEVLGSICFFSREIRKPDKDLIEMMAAIGRQFGLFVKRKQAGEKLHMLSHAIEQSSSTIVITDASGKIEYANPKFFQLTGYSIEEAIGKNPRILKSNKMHPKVYKDLWKTITSGSEWKGELCNRKRNGDFYWETASISPVKNAEGAITSFIAIKDDITEKKKMEEALLQSEKLKSISTITAGIAHDFNNILAIISGTTQLLEIVHNDNEELSNELQIITKAAYDGAEISSKMLKFTKTVTDTKSFMPCDVTDLITQSIDFTKPRWKNEAQAKGIKYLIDTGDKKSTPSILCNPAEIREIFINLINNALDAMPEGGRISFNTWRDDDTVFITVFDTGEGISGEIKKNIFDPFFSTKGASGTGLGLSMVFGLVTRHNGEIEVESEIGKGATFTLQFPATNKKAEQIDSTTLEQEINEKHQRILVVDDEYEMLNILYQFLTKGGYKVKTVDNGADAIDIVKDEDFDLVLCDLAMPDVFGIEVIKTINRLEKKPKIGVISGWEKEFEIVENEELHVDFYQKKPFKFKELAKRIDETISTK